MSYSHSRCSGFFFAHLKRSANNHKTFALFLVHFECVHIEAATLGNDNEQRCECKNVSCVRLRNAERMRTTRQWHRRVVKTYS